MFVFKGVQEGRRPTGQPFVEAVKAALQGIEYLEPGRTASFPFRAAPGTFEGFSPDTNAGFVLQVG